MTGKTIVMLARAKRSTNIIYNALKEDFEIVKVIIEQPVPKAIFLKRRVKRNGILKVTGQIVFKLIVVPYLKITSRNRIHELEKRYGLNGNPIDNSKVINVTSVNSSQTISLLQELNPDCVVVKGTRIITGKVLECISAPFINIHAGITPLYRGGFGVYWALVDGKKEVCGVTIHLVDTGIDTGGILEQGTVEPEKEDNFVTYESHLLAVGIPLFKKAIKSALENRIQTKPNPEGVPRLISHPTLWEYIWYRLRYGVR